MFDMTLTELLFILIDDAFFSAIAAVGFSLIFNVPQRLLFLCAMGGALAHSTRTLLLLSGGSIVISSFIAAALVGWIGVYWSRKYLVPRPVFTVASIIPMIPGTYAFQAMMSLFSLHQYGYTPELVASLLENGLTMTFILMAISFGLALPSVVIYRFKPIV